MPNLRIHVCKNRKHAYELSMQVGAATMRTVRGSGVADRVARYLGAVRVMAAVAEAIVFAWMGSLKQDAGLSMSHFYVIHSVKIC